jgi:dTDP-glucose 4,6-dehydratase
MTPAIILVTGGAGFIGSNFVRAALLRQPPVRVINVDALTYAGNLESLADVAGDSRYRFVRGDIRDAATMARLLAGRLGPGEPEWLPDAVIHFAAESHVDRSITGPAAFVETNVAGTLTLLEACRAELLRQPRPFRFVHVSTDEVYGSLTPTDRPFTERTPIAANSPYSASKAGSDLMVRAYVETHHLSAIITRCSNNYGPFQFPEKLIPLMITRALRDETLPVYGDGLNVRDWIHVLDHVDALWTVLTKGTPGEVYNIGGEAETTNITIVREVLRLLGKGESLIKYVTDRPGHDRRYAMDNTKITTALGWTPQRTLTAGLAETVAWYLANRTWWERVLSEAYRSAHALYLNG